MQPGRILLGRYRLVRPLGAGSHGTVWLGEDLGRGGRDVAVKITSGIVGGEADSPAQRLLTWFRHPNWADVLDVGRLGEQDWFQVLRYVRGEPVASLQGPQAPERVWRFLEDGARVLRALHQRSLIHYDVTPANFLVEEADGGLRFVLGDGGLAHIGPLLGIARGSPLYLAPELTEDRPHDHRVDLYSLGLVAFELATGHRPFEGGAGDVLGRRRREPAPRARSFRPDLPEALDELLADLLARDPSARPSDGSAVLLRVAAGTGRPVPEVTHEEALAAAGGGPLVGHGEILSRLRHSLRALATHETDAEGVPTQGRSAPILDPVLLLRGPTGVGATRVGRELRTIVREAEIPVLLLTGREGIPELRDPLGRLLEGVNALAGLSVREEERRSADTAGHERERAIERLIHTMERVSRTTPFVLVVEDLPDLPEITREAMRVLARYLLGRAEHSSGPAQPAFALVLDLGESDPTPYLLPDSSDPRRPVVEIAPLPAADLKALCASRFHGLDVTGADLVRLELVSHGIPGNVVALLAEAARLGDLRHESGRWVWDLDRIEGYQLQKGLAPLQQDALDHGSPLVRAVVEYASLVEAPLSEAVLVAVLGREEHVPASPLLARIQQPGGGAYAPAGLAVRQAVLERLSPAEVRERQLALLAALDRAPHPISLFDRARLRFRVGRVADGVGLLDEEASSLTPDERMRMQPLLGEALGSDPALLHDPRLREQVAGLLHQGTHATELALRLAASASPSAEHLAANLKIAAVLEAVQRHVEALDLLDRQDATGASDALAADLHISRARLALLLRRTEAGGAAYRRAADHMRRLGSARREHLRLLAQRRAVDARLRFSSNPNRSLRAIRAAICAARHACLPALRATLLNHAGLVFQHSGRPKQALQAWTRSLRLRRAVGDIRGALSTSANLARLYSLRREHLRSAVLLSDAASLALRHGLSHALVRALWLLAENYDLQDSTRLSLQTLQRAARTASAAGIPDLSLYVLADLVPLSAAMGAMHAHIAARRQMATFARNRSTDDARAQYFLAAAVATLHCGHAARARALLCRAQRLMAALGDEYACLRDHIGPLTDVLLGRPVSQTERNTRRPPRSNLLARRFFRATLLLLRTAPPVRETPGADAVPPARRRHSTLPPGPAGRLMLECMLLTDRVVAAQPYADRLASLASILSRMDLRLPLARTLAQLAISPRARTVTERAHFFSEATALVAEALQHMGPATRVPDELLSAGRHLDPAAAACHTRPVDLMAIQAQAHRLLVQSRALSSHDQRFSVALRKVLDAAAGLRAGSGVTAILDAMTKHTIEVTGARRACVLLMEFGSDSHVRMATSASSEADRFEEKDLSNTVIRRVLKSREPLLLHDVFDDSELLGRPSILGLSLRSILCVPVVRRDTLYGVMYADTTSTAAAFDRVDLEVLRLFAEQAAAALETARLVEDLQRSYADLKAMQERLVQGERLRVIGELSSGVAHEFNNLLTSILARVQMMSMGYVSAEMRRDLELVEKAALDAAGVVRRLQSFSRQQRQADFVRLDIADICADAIEFLRPLWRGRRQDSGGAISVEAHTEEGLWVRGDPTELREVVTNLLKNALDALPGAGRITLMAGRRPGKIRVRIQDDGCGIAPENLSRVFDPFFTTKGERGTGLGLCLSQQIAERHAGGIEIESQQGQGTTVTLTLPSYDCEAAVLPSLQRTTMPREPVRVLVVDDDSNVLKPLCSYLSRAGFAVTSAESGTEGLEAVRRHPPDVVLSDIGMPVMDGLELCRRIQELDPSTPTILMSGWASDIDPAAIRAAGARGLVAKPFAMQQVSELLASVARRRSTDQPARHAAK